MKNLNLTQYLQHFYELQTDKLKTSFMSDQLQKARSNLKQIFDLDNPELVEQLETELILMNITLKYEAGVIKFMQNTNCLGYLIIRFNNLEIKLYDLITYSNPLYNSTQTVLTIRKNILKI